MGMPKTAPPAGPVSRIRYKREDWQVSEAVGERKGKKKRRNRWEKCESGQELVNWDTRRSMPFDVQQLERRLVWNSHSIQKVIQTNSGTLSGVHGITSRTWLRNLLNGLFFVFWVEIEDEVWWALGSGEGRHNSGCQDELDPAFCVLRMTLQVAALGFGKDSTSRRTLHQRVQGIVVKGNEGERGSGDK